MFRHSSSLGGIGIMAFYLQQRFNLRAGYFQLTVDTLILSCALMFIAWHLVLISILAAFCLNMVISLNHRPERYSPAKSDGQAKTNSAANVVSDSNTVSASRAFSAPEEEHVEDMLDGDLHPQNG
jgi:uncharacterized membrane-anchored protein YitT (DUF2179 family)